MVNENMSESIKYHSPDHDILSNPIFKFIIIITNS
jgi:hypothetical protein